MKARRTATTIDERDTVFVLMPFAEPFNKYYRAVFQPAVEAAGLAIQRADDSAGPTPIVMEIWRSICRSRVILAELTGHNSNVMYEVGLSHAIDKPVILVAQNIEDVPSDLKSLRCILYDTTDPDWASRLTAEITRSLKTTLDTGVLGPFSMPRARTRTAT